MLKRYCSILLALFISVFSVAQDWKDSKVPVDKRVDDLLSKLTLEEKISQCSSDIPAIIRLGIPAYMWYFEALHGLMSWNCTSFPQNIAMGSTWDPDLMFDVATAISNESRALKNAGSHQVMIYSPTVNIARDPRWGRNEECYSEDPFLLSEMARMYIRGMQGNDKKYLKTVCTIKHFIANNVEKNREYIQSYINEKDLREYYMPAFRTCITDEEAGGVMTALNGLNGIPCSGNDWLINKVLRNEWGFKGYVVADWNAASGMFKNMKYAKSYPDAAAIAIKSGCDQECFRPNASPMVKSLKQAIDDGLLTEKELDKAVRHLLRMKFLTGDFDDASKNPWSNIPKSVLECDAHRALALRAAEKSIVLLKNENNILPLNPSIKSIAVVGPFADKCWLGIYSGFPKHMTSPLNGIKKATSAKINYAQGCSVTGNYDKSLMDKAIQAAKESEVAIVIVGNDASTSTENIDRKNLRLPGAQQQLIEEIYKVNKNIIVVLEPCGPTIIGESQNKVPGIICAWANGQEQGTALANILFGKVNPGGKLTSTWVNDESDLPNIYDFDINHGRTYMYFKGKPLYPFGYGLSYSSFNITDIKVNTNNLQKDNRLKVDVTVSNVGKMDGDEIVQLYIRDVKSTIQVPEKTLKGFKRVNLKKGESKRITIEVPYEAFAHYSVSNKRFEVEGGEFEILIGNSSDNIAQKTSVNVVSGAVATVNINNKSGWFDKNNPNRIKKWDHIYNDKSFLNKKAANVKDKGGVKFTINFTDPGFYVPSWEATLYCTMKSKNASVNISMMDLSIGDYKMSGQDSDRVELPIKIPIPPQYGKDVDLTIKTLTGSINVESIKIFVPEGKEVIIKEPNKK